MTVSKVTCPTCKKRSSWQHNPHRPFCSDRCRNIDLANWADESYCIPGREVEDENIKNFAELKQFKNKELGEG